MNFIRNKFWSYLSKKAGEMGHQPAPILDNESERLKELKSLGVIEKNIQKDQRFSSLPRLASYLTNCPQAWINIIDKDTQHCKVDFGKNSVLSYMMGRGVPRGLTVCQFVINNNCEPLVIEDCTVDERTKILAEASGGGFPKFYAGSPVVSKNGFILGTFCVVDENPRTITHEQLDGLRLLADQFVELLDTPSTISNNDIGSEEAEISGQYYSLATVLFADFVGFTSKTEKLQPGELLKILNSYFQGFDKIVERFGLKKVKTIGDAYMSVGGIPDKNSNHAFDVCSAGMEMMNYVNGAGVQQKALGKDTWELRIGINTGPVIAGHTENGFDIWGDTVNLAARLESSSEPGRIQIAEKTKQFIQESAKVTFREKVVLKDKGNVDTFYLDELE
ncbi:MAG: adenylate/guanylate cyclase domain-containing protein [Candidatus Marinimicrobia bacterium]|jgi:class 3 adenylate cyclase|nr:adenylate/guanylate cyclase domain-containing protein [Candidatus Neomarinimicrobiota bacterium]